MKSTTPYCVHTLGGGGQTSAKGSVPLLLETVTPNDDKDVGNGPGAGSNYWEHSSMAAKRGCMCHHNVRMHSMRKLIDQEDVRTIACSNDFYGTTVVLGVADRVAETHIKPGQSETMHFHSSILRLRLLKDFYVLSAGFFDPTKPHVTQHADQKPGV
ncbi:hypothetical protein BDZ97DRAFT_1770143 [Flammula alnicola]|nr:hypothetical protein BDZ97DRAFT_1770143 [Flammula alnicola]